jgi:hypothetical protein
MAKMLQNNELLRRLLREYDDPRQREVPDKRLPAATNSDYNACLVT